MIPNITKESLENVVETLEDRFPNSLPKTRTDVEHIHILIGQQQVIRHLKELLEAKYG